MISCLSLDVFRWLMFDLVVSVHQFFFLIDVSEKLLSDIFDCLLLLFHFIFVGFVLCGAKF